MLNGSESSQRYIGHDVQAEEVSLSCDEISLHGLSMHWIVTLLHQFVFYCQGTLGIRFFYCYIYVDWVSWWMCLCSSAGYARSDGSRAAR